MREDGDLRARIEARVAARRQATGRPTPGLNGRTPQQPSGETLADPDDTAAPASSGVPEAAADTEAADTDAESTGDTEAADAEAADTDAAEAEAPAETGADGSRPRPGPGRRRPKPPASRPAPAPAPEPQRDPASKSAPKSPDISRFLEASEPRPDDDVDDDEQKPSATAQNTRKALRVLLRIAVIVGIAVGAALLLRTYVVAPYYIPSESMEPTLHGCTGCNDDHVLVDKISYRLHDPHQSDIVVFTRPPAAKTNDHVLIKRVIGLPGDRIALKHGNVYVNGKRLKEPYVRKACGPHPTRPETGQSRWQVPKGDLFVLGDNRCDSMDSREFGPITESSVVGRAFAIIWPLGRIGLL